MHAVQEQIQDLGIARNGRKRIVIAGGGFTGLHLGERT